MSQLQTKSGIFISHIGDVLSRRMHDLLRRYPRLEARRA